MQFALCSLLCKEGEGAMVFEPYECISHLKKIQSIAEESEFVSSYFLHLDVIMSFMVWEEMHCERFVCI
jgi:hypothetical protein